MDRCALFVDAGYVLADGAMAVHGTRHRESVSWDYAGLLSFMGSIARERTGRPLLRCYWYEASVEGRRTSEHDSLADLPGLKLRLGRTRPGRREGVESEIRRDLTTLARNNAISDALLVSAEEDLAQVVADVQDLGIRVTIVHITVGGNWTISRSLRQECDDIIEIGEGHLRPFTQLVAGTDSLGSEEPYHLAVSATRALTNGHGTVAGPLGQQALSAGSHPAPPAIYTAPVVAEYQRAAQPGAQPASAQLPQCPAPGHPASGRPAGRCAVPVAAPRAARVHRAPVHGGRPRRGRPVARGRQRAGPWGPAAECAESAGCLRTAGAAWRFRAATKPRTQPELEPGPATAGSSRAAGPAGPAGLGSQQGMGGVPAQPGMPGPGQQSMAGQQAMQPQSYAPPSLPPQSLPAQGMPGQAGQGRGCRARGCRASRTGTASRACRARACQARASRARAWRARPSRARASRARGMASQARPAEHARPARACPASRASRDSRACRDSTRRRLRPRRRHPRGCRTRGCVARMRSLRPMSRTCTRRRHPRSPARPRTSRPGRTSRGPTACCPRSR